jgi:Alginate lyase
MSHKSLGRIVIRLALVVACTVLMAPSVLHAADKPPTPPKTFVWDGAHLALLRTDEAKNNPRYREVMKRLRKNAEIARKRGPYSVVNKHEVAPSGDKHDYLSYARYWWPNPDTPDGMPYIRRDGKTNKDLLEKGDRETIGMLYDDLETLALAGYLLNDDASAKHAALLLRTWFLDSATRMNPHMRYGQAVPGRNDGRGSGIIDTRHFIRVCDSVALLNETDAWSDSDQLALIAWMKQYLDWLRNDPMGKDESSEENNHGTWYDAQVAAIAMFVGEHETARQIVKNAKVKRIASSIQPNGEQPAELERTKGLHYCVFNMSAMAVLARIGEQLDEDLWTYESDDGRSLRRGLDFVLPYLTGEKKWPHEQIEEMSVSPSDVGLFFLAARRYRDPRYLRAIDREFRDPDKFQYGPLLFPAD